MNTATLEERREAERQKYIGLQSSRPTYGASNHGAKALPILAEWGAKSVVDFGCGQNQFALSCRTKGIDAKGVDFAYPEADVAAPVHATGLPDASADTVTSFDALEHLLPEDVSPTLAEMRRVCKPGGRFILSIAYKPSNITASGENLHPTVQPRDWWFKAIGDAGGWIQGVKDRYIVGVWSEAGKAEPLPLPRRPLRFTPASGQPVPLSNLFRGKSAFLVCGGPSLARMDLTALSRPGVLSMGINNSWLLHRPTLWTCGDDCGRFADTGWKDPGIMKFVPSGHRRDILRVQNEDGTFKNSLFRAEQMPNVWTFPRRSFFDHRSFLDGDSICWGQEKDVPDSLGIKGGLNTMLQAMHILHAVGVRTVYIIGADFKMRPEQPYAFAQGKAPSGIKSNNRTYEVLTERFTALAPHFAARGLRVFNATDGGELSAFPRIAYEDAVRFASRECSKTVSAAGWYEGKTGGGK